MNAKKCEIPDDVTSLQNRCLASKHYGTAPATGHSPSVKMTQGSPSVPLICQSFAWQWYDWWHMFFPEMLNHCLR